MSFVFYLNEKMVEIASNIVKTQLATTDQTSIGGTASDTIDKVVSNMGSYFKDKADAESIWNAKALYAEDVVFITETWTDAFSIIQNGSSAIALNRIGNIITLWSILQKFPKASANRYYIACDADEYGRRITSDLHSMLNSLGLSHYDIPPYPDEIKDCNEWLIADPKGFHAMISYIISQA